MQSPQGEGWNHLNLNGKCFYSYVILYSNYIYIFNTTYVYIHLRLINIQAEGIKTFLRR